MSFKYFYRTFLADPDDCEDDGSYVVARVQETSEEYASASLTLSDGYSDTHISFWTWKDDEDKEKAKRKLQRLKDVLTEFLSQAEEELGKMK